MAAKTVLQLFTEGSLLGLGTGLSCAAFCIPVLFGLSSRNIHTITNTNDTMFFLLGRFIAYTVVAFVFSTIGVQVQHFRWLKTISEFLIAVFLFYWGIKGFLDVNKYSPNCHIKKYAKTVPIIAGIITGFSPCPPFIIGISRIIALGNIINGVVFFIGFYISTSLLLLLGLLTGLAEFKKEIRIIICHISIIMSLIFFIRIFFSFTHI